MAPPKSSKSSNSIDDRIDIIKSNWRIRPVDNCIPKGLWPNKRFEEWDDEIIILLSQISSMPAATVSDFRARLKNAIRIRQEKNSSMTGKQGWAKAVDLRAVLKEYEREAEEIKAGEALSAPKANGRNGSHVTRTARTQVPKTPVNHEDDEEDEEEGSSEPLAGGKYQYLNDVRPVKVNLNPTASAAKKPTRPRVPPRGKRRKANEDEILDPHAVELPSLVYQDPDPRVPDDTGFLSDLEGNEAREEGRKRKKRLSRLEQRRIREPHWQKGHDNIAVDTLGLARCLGTAVVEDEEEAAPVPDVDDREDLAMNKEEDVAVDSLEDAAIHNGQNTVLNSTEDVETQLENLPEIPQNATVTERREMEELRLRMEQRLWRIKVLRIKERGGGGSEVAEGEDENVNVDKDVGGKSRVLRKRRGK